MPVYPVHKPTLNKLHAVHTSEESRRPRRRSVVHTTRWPLIPLSMQTALLPLSCVSVATYLCRRSATLKIVRGRQTWFKLALRMRTKRGDQDFFQEFLQTWLHRSEAVLHRLHHMSRDPSCEPQHRALVTEAMDYQGAYFSAKSDLARRDATHALSPPWLNPMARALLWVGGWRPTVAFRLVTSTVRTSEEQARQMEEMKRITREEEVAVEKEMERVQLGIVGMVRAGTGTAAEAAVIGSVMVGMGKVAAAADRLRMEALTRVVGTLSPSQAVDFLAAVVELQLGLHMN